MKFIVPVLSVFLCTSCLSSVVKHKGFSTEVNDKGMPYDMPAIPPIPPEKYCFEQSESGAHIARGELFITGDSVLGQIDYANKSVGISGTMSGIIYGSTLIVNYKFKTDSGIIIQDQKWKLSGDSLYRTDVNRASNTDTSTLLPVFTGALHKVPCK